MPAADVHRLRFGLVDFAVDDDPNGRREGAAVNDDARRNFEQLSDGQALRKQAQPRRNYKRNC